MCEYLSLETIKNSSFFVWTYEQIALLQWNLDLRSTYVLSWEKKELFHIILGFSNKYVHTMGKKISRGDNKVNYY
jgi:hypothetical protein